MLGFVTKECEEALLFFGYANLTSDDKGYVIKNATEEQKANFGKYKQTNEEAITWYAKDKATID